ncbi:hypothetical protein [uncultured Desulfovibrio sp.]|mgnify:FL=1|uniref:hypothetical protein n=1 Tax=uncultured Desulfovibrio sp. TaxID=167968 RepID=UPI00265CBE53|nr:hypothetical protein [uncultured Desulfovibrio sp.]
MEQLFKECCNLIDAEYKRLGHTLGYRFFLCPRCLLNLKTKILYLGLNPGGKEDLPEHPRTSCENGTAFFTESWKNNAPGTENLQVQTQLLFEKLRNHLGIHGMTTREFADSHILSAYFVPFRSNSWESLPKKTESIKSASKLWEKIFSYWMPTYIMTLGRDNYIQIEKFLLKNNFTASLIENIPAGWGSYSHQVRTFYRKEQTIYLGTLLHLSHYSIMGKAKYAPAVDDFLTKMHLS